MHSYTYPRTLPAAAVRMHLLDLIALEAHISLAEVCIPAPVASGYSLEDDNLGDPSAASAVVGGG